MKSKTTTLLLILGIGAAGYFFFVHDSRVSPNPAQVTLSEVPPPPVPAIVQPIAQPEPTPEIGYHLLSTTSPTPGAELLKEVGKEHLDFVLALNRIDVRHMPPQAVFVIPDSFDDTDIYAPFPKTIDAAKDIPKLFIVSKRVQAFGAYENGVRVRWGTLSTGKQSTPTPSRLYGTNWKGKLVTSTLEDAYILPWYFNLDSMEGISIHQFDLPGYPASHSCIRMTAYDAEWFYSWADQWILAPDGQTKLADGTPFIVFGEYQYSKTAPWKNLATNPDATTLSDQELQAVVEEHLPEIQSRAKNRAEILEQQAE